MTGWAWPQQFVRLKPRTRVTSGRGTLSARSVVDLGGRRAVDIGWAWLLHNKTAGSERVGWILTTKRRWFFPRRTCSWRDFFLTASALKYNGKNTLLLGESLSVGTVLFENDSHLHPRYHLPVWMCGESFVDQTVFEGNRTFGFVCILNGWHKPGCQRIKF